MGACKSNYLKIMYKQFFPNLSDYQITSKRDRKYNCIALAAEDNQRWWWPDPKNQKYWPPDIPRQETLEAFIVVFENLGYVTCDNSNYQSGYEKIAIFVNDQGKPKHAAKQLPNGRWNSKLGECHDIEHVLEEIEGQTYGKVAIIMRRSSN